MVKFSNSLNVDFSSNNADRSRTACNCRHTELTCLEHSDQYKRVPKHGGMLFLFNPVIALVEL
jgi:hypothetical protein